MAFNTAPFENCEGLFYCLALWQNEVTNGYFWSILLMAFGIIVFMGTFNFGVRRSFGYASLSMTLVGLLLIQLAFIPLWFFTLTLIVGALGLVFMIVGEN